MTVAEDPDADQWMPGSWAGHDGWGVWLRRPYPLSSFPELPQAEPGNPPRHVSLLRTLAHKSFGGWRKRHPPRTVRGGANAAPGWNRYVGKTDETTSASWPSL